MTEHTAQVFLHPTYMLGDRLDQTINAWAYKRGYRCGWRDREAVMEASLERWAFYAEHNPSRKVGFDAGYACGYHDAGLCWSVR